MKCIRNISDSFHACAPRRLPLRDLHFIFIIIIILDNIIYHDFKSARARHLSYTTHAVKKLPKTTDGPLNYPREERVSGHAVVFIGHGLHRLPPGAAVELWKNHHRAHSNGATHLNNNIYED
jgi:hypothetical protein